MTCGLCTAEFKVSRTSERKDFPHYRVKRSPAITTERTTASSSAVRKDDRSSSELAYQGKMRRRHSRRVARLAPKFIKVGIVRRSTEETDERMCGYHCGARTLCLTGPSVKPTLSTLPVVVLPARCEKVTRVVIAHRSFVVNRSDEHRGEAFDVSSRRNSFEESLLCKPSQHTQKPSDPSQLDQEKTLPRAVRDRNDKPCRCAAYLDVDRSASET